MEFKWSTDVMLPNGKRYRRVIGTKKEADKVQRKLESEIVEGKWGVRETEDVPFTQLTEEYVVYAKLVFNTPANPIKPHKHWVLLFDITNFRLKRLVFHPKRDDISN